MSLYSINDMLWMEQCRSFLLHDIFQDMEVNGARVADPTHLKAFLGSISEHGGARPWESQLIYDAMQRAGVQVDVRLIAL